MKKKYIYRKLKDYIYEGEDNGVEYTTVIFGNLTSSNCIFSYENPNKKGEWVEHEPNGVNLHNVDFLLNYYVVGISPSYKIIKHTIKPMLHITLRKDIEGLL